MKLILTNNFQSQKKCSIICSADCVGIIKWDPFLGIKFERNFAGNFQDYPNNALPKTNMEPKNHPIEKVNHVSSLQFWLPY